MSADESDAFYRRNPDYQGEPVIPPPDERQAGLREYLRIALDATKPEHRYCDPKGCWWAEAEALLSPTPASGEPEQSPT